MKNRPVFVSVANKKKKYNAFDKAINKATAAVNKELGDQMSIVISAASLAMHRHLGWGSKRLYDLMDTIVTVYNECGKVSSLSMLILLEDETGIEMQNGNGISYHKIKYLGGNVEGIIKLSDPEFLYMRKRELDWCSVTVMAGVLCALHRHFGFGYERLNKAMQWTDEIRRELKTPANAERVCKEEIGLTFNPERVGKDL